MKPERFIVVTTLEEQDLAEQASDRKTTAAERFAAVSDLLRGSPSVIDHAPGKLLGSHPTADLGAQRAP
jgi:hypothetical protein